MPSINSVIGLGIIGCGAVSYRHILESQGDKRCRWVAACDINPEAIQIRADKFGIPNRYTSADELLGAPAVDAVVVATPPPFHMGHSLSVLNANKHLLVEKPVALNTNEVQQILDACGAGLVTACCSSRFRATATARRATEIVASMEFGAVRRLSCTVLVPPLEKIDGTNPNYLYKPNWGGLGVLGEWGCYDLDYLLGICGWSLMPKVVLANIQKLPSIYREKYPPRNDTEVQVSAKFRFDSGVTLDYHRADYFAGEPRSEWAIECERGRIEISMVPKKPQLVVHRYTASGIESKIEIEEAEKASTIMGGPILDFVGAIFEKRAPLTDLKQSLIVQRMTDAVYASAESGQVVSV